MMGKETWRRHRDLWWKYTELVPIGFASRISNPAPSKNTNLEDGTIVDMDGLWIDLLQHGVVDPIILQAGVVTRTMRVDVGNHRVKVLAENGVKVVPAICIVDRDCVGTLGNGAHRFPAIGEIVPKKLISQSPRLCKPSEAFASLKGWCKSYDPRRPFDVKPYLTMR